MDKRELSFGEHARRAMNRRRKIDKWLYEWGRLADEHPVEVARHLFGITVCSRRMWRRQYDRRVKRAKRRVVLDNNEYARIVSAEYSEPHEARRIIHALHMFTVWECAFRNMMEAGPAGKAVGEDPFRKACDGFFSAHLDSHELLYVITRPQWMGPELREEIAASLTGQVAARISLSRNKRLRTALSDSRGSTTERLMQELPGAVVYAWGSPPSDDNQPWLFREVVHLLEKQAKEQDRLAQAGKLAGELSDSAGAEDEDIAEFERRETLQQELGQLRRWVEGSDFSEAEAWVYELDIETDFDTGAIAQKLGVSPSTVRGYRKRYIAKIRKVAGL